MKNPLPCSKWDMFNVMKLEKDMICRWLLNRQDAKGKVDELSDQKSRLMQIQRIMWVEFASFSDRGVLCGNH